MVNVPFFNFPTTPSAAPTTDYQVANKKYVDDNTGWRITSEASSATPTINVDNCDIHRITALAVNITSMSTNLSGTPTHGQLLRVEITGTAAREIDWGDSFEESSVLLPLITNSTNMLSTGFTRNSATSKWRCIASA